MIYLLDVNVLVALLDRRHSFYTSAHRWFGNAIGPTDGWATCAITENGFLRVGSSGEYAGDRTRKFWDQMAALETLCYMENHRFWVSNPSIRDMLWPGAAISPKQITDIYLLGLAAVNGGRFATFDRKIPGGIIDGGREALEVIVP